MITTATWSQTLDSSSTPARPHNRTRHASRPAPRKHKRCSSSPAAGDSERLSMATGCGAHACSGTISRNLRRRTGRDGPARAATTLQREDALPPPQHTASRECSATTMPPIGAATSMRPRPAAAARGTPTLPSAPAPAMPDLLENSPAPSLAASRSVSASGNPRPLPPTATVLFLHTIASVPPHTPHTQHAGVSNCSRRPSFRARVASVRLHSASCHPHCTVNMHACMRLCACRTPTPPATPHHIPIAPSYAPETKLSPYASITRTASACPLATRTHSNVAMSQNMTALS